MILTVEGLEGERDFQETRNLNIPGSNEAASNNGEIIKWENVMDQFAWRHKRQTVGKCLF